MILLRLRSGDFEPIGSSAGLQRSQGILFDHLAELCQTSILAGMGTMNISLPDMLKSFVDEQVVGRGYGTSSEYVRELIRKDRDRQRLRRLLLNGAESAPDVAADAAYFDTLRERTRRAQ